MSADMRRTPGGETPEAMTRLDELLADRALQGLSAEEERELESLLVKFGDVDAESFDRAAAAVDLALGEQAFQPMPAGLKARIAASAALTSTQFRSAHHRAIAEHVRPSGSALSPLPRSSFMLWSGWVAAAAAILFVLYVIQFTTKVGTRGSTDIVAELADVPNKLLAIWKPATDPMGKHVSGEVVWCKAKQSGYMRFSGLPKNDPSQQQYQLWIFDRNQDDKYPIDGGVFDIDALTGNVIVPIHAKLGVVSPKMFAVTMEKPGGVVVSGREHLLATAEL